MIASSKYKLLLIGAGFVFIAAGFVNCSNPLSVQMQNPVKNASELKVTSLGKGTFTIGQSFEYELLKLEKAGAPTTYAQWIKKNSTAVGAAVLIEDPYSGIQWSGDTVDLKWAHRPNASTGYMYPDEDGPMFDAATSKQLRYQLFEPQATAAQGVYYLLNDMSVLVVFGRFYAGSDLNQEIQETTLGLEFLGQQPSVDPAKIGIFGISWGGFRAIYGALHAGVRPTAGVAVAPPSDFDQQTQYIENFLPQQISNGTLLDSYKNFFEPYFRRIKASTGSGPNRFQNFNSSFVANQMQTPFLLVHDDWDTLVPSSQSHELANLNANRFQIFIFPHEQSINFNNFAMDHQQTTEGLTWEGMIPWIQAYFLNRLKGPASNKTIFYRNSPLNTSLLYFRQKQINGVDIQTLNQRLVELCEPNVQMHDSDSGITVTGPHYLSVIMSSIWGWTKSEAEVCSGF